VRRVTRVRRSRPGAVLELLACDAPPELHLRPVGEGNADFRALPPHHPAVALPSGCCEVQHENIGQIGVARVNPRASIGYVGGNAIDGGLLPQKDLDRNPDPEAFGLTFFENGDGHGGWASIACDAPNYPVGLDNRQSDFIEFAAWFREVVRRL
jgi:hypothetical protein